MSVRASAALPSICSGAMYGKRAEQGPFPRQVGRGLGGLELARVGSADERRDRLRQAEVEELHARPRQHHVAGLQVAVNDPLAVRLRPGHRRSRRRSAAPGREAGDLFGDDPGAFRPRAAPSPGSPSSSWRPTSKSAQMCGCESREIVLASRSNRWRASGDEDRCRGRTLIATDRSRRVSRAL